MNDELSADAKRHERNRYLKDLPDGDLIAMADATIGGEVGLFLHQEAGHRVFRNADARGALIEAILDEEESEEEQGHDVETICYYGPEGIIKHEIRNGPYKTASAEHIMQTLFPRWAEHFLAKNADYGDQHRYALGPKAEWVGIDRKITKLENAIWNEREMNGEQVAEMLYDLIGQSFILLDLLDGNWEPRSRNVRREAP